MHLSIFLSKGPQRLIENADSRFMLSESFASRVSEISVSITNLLDFPPFIFFEKSSRTQFLSEFTDFIFNDTFNYFKNATRNARKGSS